MSGYHDSTRELKKLLQEKDIYEEERWEKIQKEGLDTMEQLAHHCCKGGGVSQPLDHELMIKMIKKVEGDWEVPTQQYEDGKKLDECPKRCRHKPAMADRKTNHEHP